jgi:hypothetical protein
VQKRYGSEILIHLLPFVENFDERRFNSLFLSFFHSSPSFGFNFTIHYKCIIIYSICRYQNLATACLINFFSEFDKSIESTPLLPYLDRLMSTLSKLIEDQNNEIRKQAMWALISVGEAFKTEITKVRL